MKDEVDSLAGVADELQVGQVALADFDVGPNSCQVRERSGAEIIQHPNHMVAGCQGFHKVGANEARAPGHKANSHALLFGWKTWAPHMLSRNHSSPKSLPKKGSDPFSGRPEAPIIPQ